MGLEDRIIIGSGISGLIWKFYHREFEIISPVQTNKADQFTRSNMVWLHDCYETRKLLSDLGWEKVEKMVEKCVIGYFYKRWICDNPSPELSVELIQKKMTHWNEEPEKKFLPKSTDLSMTSDLGVNYMKVLRVDNNEPIKRLKQVCPITHGYVNYIGEGLVGISNSPGESGVYNGFSHLVSTIPAPFFWKAWDESQLKMGQTKREFNWLPITNAIVKKKPVLFDDRYEMIYYDNSVSYSRISKHEHGYTIEFTGSVKKDEFSEMFPEMELIDIFEVPMGRVFSQENISPMKNIIFSGRFAQWNHVITTEYVVNQALNFKA